MRVPVSRRDRRLWGAALSLGILLSGIATTKPAAAYYCCRYDRAEVLFAPAPAVSEDAALSWSYIDPNYILTRILIPIIYASLIIRVIWLIQRK